MVIVDGFYKTLKILSQRRLDLRGRSGFFGDICLFAIVIFDRCENELLYASPGYACTSQ